MEDDLQEWEVIHNPESDFVDSSLPGIEGDSPKTLIKSDYFAFGSNSEGKPEDVEFEGKQQVEDLIEIEANKSKDCQGGGSEHQSNDFEGGIEVRETPVSVENLVEEDHLVDEMEINGGGAIVHQLESENKKMVGWWWNHPFQLLKFCVFRVSPVWTFSLAAAVVGIVILSKRLSRIKQKTRTIPINLTVEDKKVSQFMVRAARLNEAFSVVRRVPIIRPISLSGGVTPWPALNLR